MLVNTSQFCLPVLRKATQSFSDVLVQTHSHKEPNRPLSVLLLTHQPPSHSHTVSSQSCAGQRPPSTQHMLTEPTDTSKFSLYFYQVVSPYWSKKRVITGLSETEVCTQLILLKTKTASAAMESFIKVQFSSKEDYTQDFSKLDKTEISLDFASAHFLAF